MGKMGTSNKYLNFSNFKHLKFWDYYSLSKKSQIQSKYNLVELSEILTHRKEYFTIKDNCLYKRCRVQTRGQGVVLRDEVLGKEIKTKKQQVCKVDDFLVAEIDAKVGGYGIVPDYLDGAIVSGHYFLFEINKSKVLPDFLSILVKCKDFSKQIKATGSTNYAAIRPYHVLEYIIPLPSLHEQYRIVDEYTEKIKLAEELERKAKYLTKYSNEALLKTLDIQTTKTFKKSKGLSFVPFSKSDRWDVMYLLGNIPFFNSKYELVLFSKIITFFNKNSDSTSIRINTTSYPKDDFLFIGMESIEKETGKLLEFQKVKGAEIKSQALKVPKGFILFGRLRPYLNKYWINDSEHENIICSSEFFVFDITKEINKQYFMYALSSVIVQNQIADKTSGARMPRINEDIFFNLKIPLPELTIQEKLVKELDKLKKDSSEYVLDSLKFKQQALKEFENEIFQLCN